MHSWALIINKLKLKKEEKNNQTKKYKYYWLSEYWVSHLDSSIRESKPQTCTTMKLMLKSNENQSSGSKLL